MIVQLPTHGASAGMYLDVQLFTGVTKHDGLVGSDSLAFVDSRLVVGQLHLACAASKALQAQTEGVMRAGGKIAAELTYCLSGLKSVSESLKRFDASQSKPDSVLVVTFCASSQAPPILHDAVCGQLVVNPDGFWRPQDDLVKKVFKITDAELNMETNLATKTASGLIRPVVTRVSIRDQL